MRQIYILFIVLILVPFFGISQTFTTIAEDNASNYGSAWSGNGGTNFQNWIFQKNPDGGFAGEFLELNANGSSPAISSDNKSFGTFANSGAFPRITAYRGFNESLKPGDVLTIEIQHGGIVSGGSMGFTLRNGNSSSSADNYNTNSRFEVAFVGGNSNYSIFADSTTDTNVPFNSGGIRIKVSIVDLNTVNVELTVLATNSVTTLNNIVLGGTSNSEIESFALFNRNAREANVYFNNLKIERPTFTTIADGNVNNSATWDNGDVPDGTGRVVINDEVTIAEDEHLVASDLELGIDGNLILNSISNNYSSLIVDNVIGSGTVTYNRHTAQIAPTGTNDLIASPVSGQTFGAFATANAGVLAASGTLRAFAPFNTVTGNYENYDTGTNANTPITPGIGYRAATDSGQTLAFTGTPNNGAVAVSLQDNTSFWNLIGNPYPSYIDIGDFLAENVATTNINTSFYGVYGYDGDVTNGWTVWDLNVNQDLLIAPGQGFFVAAPSGGGSGIDFTTAMRRSGTSDDFIAERNTTSDANFAHAIFNLNTASASYGTNVYFRDINTLGLDPGYDTGAFDQTANGIYSHLVADNTGVALANQSLPFTSLSDQSIPLVVNANAGEQLTFSLNTNSNIPDNINIYLEDQLAGSVTLLNTNSYTLTPASNLSGPGRFYVVFSDNALTTTEQHLDHVRVYTNQSTKTINISGQLDAGTIAMVYDVQGREIITQKLSSESILQRINSDDLSTGVYIVKLYTKTKSKSVKLIIR